jgi:hypothetical protein
MGRLAKWFGFDYEESWRALAAEMEGRFTAGSWGSGSRVDVNVGDWTITLDVYVIHTGKSVIHYTRLRAPYVNPTGFRFKLFREGFFAKIGKSFGMQDVVIGVPEFDDAWVVQGTDEERLRALFSTLDLRTLLRGAGDVSFAVKDDEGWFATKFPEGVDELALTTLGLVNDLDRLRVFFALFAATLERLAETGDASSRDTGIVL